MNDIAFKVIIKNDGIDDVIFKTLMLKGEKGDKGDAGGAEIDDSTTSASKTWSSNKIRNEIDAKPVNLSQLGDVDLDTITDGQMLGYNLTAGKWENKTADASTLKYDANTTIKSKIDDKADSAGLSLVAVSGAYDDLSNKPQLADVATSGDYDDLSNKPTIPDELTELGDVDIDAISLTDGDGLKWNATTGKWENGAVSTTSALIDLTDVALDSPIPDFSSLVYNATEGKWKNKQLTIACTEAQYNTWKNASPSQLIPCTHYILTDAQNLNPKADDIEYSAGVSVADSLTSLASGQTPQAVTGISYNSTNINSPTFICYKIGRLVMLDIASISTKIALGTYEEELLTDLPLPLSDTGRYSLFDGDGTPRARVKVTSDGKLKMWHNPSQFSVGTGFYGNIYYISAN